MGRLDDAQRWTLLGCAVLVVAALSVWQHSYEATLARHKAKLVETIDRVQREVDRLQLDLTTATARSDVRGAAEAQLGLHPAPDSQVVVIAIPAQPGDEVADADASVAELGRRFLDAFLPTASAGSRVRVPMVR